MNDYLRALSDVAVRIKRKQDEGLIPDITEVINVLEELREEGARGVSRDL